MMFQHTQTAEQLKVLSVIFEQTCFHNDNDQKKIGESVPQLKDPSDPFSVGLEFSHRSVWIPGEDNDVRCSWILDLFEHILLILWSIHINPYINQQNCVICVIRDIMITPDVSQLPDFPQVLPRHLQRHGKYKPTHSLSIIQEGAP